MHVFMSFPVELLRAMDLLLGLAKPSKYWLNFLTEAYESSRFFKSFIPFGIVRFLIIAGILGMKLYLDLFSITLNRTEIEHFNGCVGFFVELPVHIIYLLIFQIVSWYLTELLEFKSYFLMLILSWPTLCLAFSFDIPSLVM